MPPRPYPAVMRGHGDTVRGLALMPGVGYLSASHDCTARLWTHGGDSAAIFAGHTALVYAVAALASGKALTGPRPHHVSHNRNFSTLDPKR